MENKDTSKKSAQAPASSTLDLSILPLEEPEEGVLGAYANVVNLDWTLYDVRLRFSELTQVPNDEAPCWTRQHAILLERVAVRIPWHQAKHLRTQLDKLIQNYEEINGELKSIKLPAAPSAD